MKPYQKIKQQRAYRKVLAVVSLAALICVSSIYFAFWYETKDAQAQVIFPKVEKPEVIEIYTPEQVKEYIKDEAEKSGIVNIDTLLKTVSCESKFKQFNSNKNKNGTWDKGIWMINSIHKVPDKCAYSLECSTNWAMQKIKERKFSPWVCFTQDLYKKEVI